MARPCFRTCWGVIAFSISAPRENIANGCTLSEDSAKANALNAQFASVFTREDTSVIPNLSGIVYPIMRPINVAVEGVTFLLANLDPSKASGPDGIPARFLKDMANGLAPSLTLIYQASLQQGRIPDEWRKALITPIYKNGDRSCLANYRPISLTCIQGRLHHVGQVGHGPTSLV